MIIGWFFAGGVLLLAGMYDIKSQCLPGWLVHVGLLGGMVGLTVSVICGNCNWLEVIYRLMPGTIMMTLSFITREQIGYGDGLVLLMLGGCVGGREIMGIWGIALLISFMVSVGLLFFRKAAPNTRFPFVPCLFWGYVIAGVGGLLSGG